VFGKASTIILPIENYMGEVYQCSLRRKEGSSLYTLHYKKNDNSKFLFCVMATNGGQ